MNKPLCTKCDRGRPIHARNMCRVCYDRWLKEINPEYHERIKAYQREKRKEPEARKKAQKRDKARWQDPVYREKDRKRKWDKVLEDYGLTQKSYDKLVAEGCQICGNKTAKRYHLDHDHKSGKFRGLLCSKCNNGLGMLGDTIEGITKALIYLEEQSDATNQV